MSTILGARPLVIYTSTSQPTVELSLDATRGHSVRASLPLGFEDGPISYREVFQELRRLGETQQFTKGLTNQRQFDLNLVSETENIENRWVRQRVRFLVSVAFAKAYAVETSTPLHSYLASTLGESEHTALPVPVITVISGGRVATTPFRVQAIMIAPTGISPFSEGLRAASEISTTLGRILDDLGQPYAIGDEGGLSTDFATDGSCDSRTILCRALDTVLRAINEAGYEPRRQVQIAIDFAADHYRVGTTGCALVTEREILSVGEIRELCDFLAARFPLLFIEDPLPTKSGMALAELHEQLRGRSLIAADDLLDFDEAAAIACDAVILMPDRLGTLSSTFEFVRKARSLGKLIIASHRSGETEDTLLADLTVACSLPFIKAGGLSGAERTGKYNQLLRIAEPQSA